MRSVWLGLVCACACVLLVTRSVGPARAQLVQRPPVEERGFKDPRRFHNRIAREKPEVVLVGNSVMDAAVDHEALAELTGRRTLRITPHGSASALWYLVLKNVLATATERPGVVVIGFRNVFLTEPDYRTQNNYRRRIDYFAGEDEPLLDELAYFGDLGPAELFLMRHWSVWQRREELRGTTEAWFKDTLAARAVGLEPPALRGAVERVFADENKRDAAVDQAQELAETVADRSHFDFPGQLGRSFLPEMVRIARESGIRLVFLRLPTRRMAKDATETAAPWYREWMPGYEADLFAYLEREGVGLIDFEGDPRIPVAWFDNGDHLGEEPGQVELTKLLAAALEPFLPGTPEAPTARR